MANSVVIKDRGWNNMIRSFRSISGDILKIGFPEEGTLRKPIKKGSKHKPVSNINEMAYIASIQEFGAKVKITEKMRNFLHSIGFHLRKRKRVLKIPPRPFIRPAFDKAQVEFGSLLSKEMSRLNNNKTKSISILRKIGRFFVKKIRDQIDNVYSPSLHPFTIKSKKSNKPLIDSGQMKKSVQYVVIKK